MRHFLIIILILLTTGCKDESPYEFDDVQDLEVFLDKLENEIRKMIGKSCSSDDQCFAIAFGSKPCGGPWEYLIYSVSSTDEVTLKAKVNQYNELQAELNQRKGLASDCEFVVEPEVACVDGNCQEISRQD